MIGKGVEVDKIPIQSMIFQLATNIKPNDVRSLLGNEIPGFYAFDYRIHIAGEGTNYTTLPHESSPPMEVLLKEREIAHEQLEEIEEEISPPPAPEKTNEKELVYIYQSHSWESFLPLLKGAKTPDEATSNNSKVNVIAVGNMLKGKLLSHGIVAKHNTTNVTEQLLSRGWNYYNSYQYSREVVEEVLSSNNELKYLIDIHRDSVRKDKTHIKINGKDYAKLLFIVGEENKNFKENLDFASNLHYAIEEHFPGLSRGVVIKNKSEGDGIYNQDLSDRSILLEVGGVDNTMVELDNSVEVFAKYFSELVWEDKDVGDF
ncbi:stage II sporulation protein P [Sutcliffiella horikoshii]|nr:stage II sporulation protein P [Bacillus sp. RO1]UAL49624.1 stage II sporulation protein P [Sutcliffiella horikoshii]